jgi:recombination endonuclease VII
VTRKQEHAALVRWAHAHYDELLAAQGGHCATCPRLPYARRYCVDVDHSTSPMRIRGLLCFTCNYFVCHRGSTPAVLRAAAAYLEDPPATAVIARLEEA